MPNYNYECSDCKDKAYKEHSASLRTDGSGDKYLPDELYEDLVVFETSHSLRPTDKELSEATECPRCGGHNVSRTLYGTTTHGYIKGYGWLDRAGVKRDMNKYKLLTDDPYGQYRVPGEVDHIKTNLEKEGKHNPKTKYFSNVGQKEMEHTVEKVVSSPSSSVE
jgi:predicted nucleic acid-binding Zn ribbon protein